MRLQQRTGHGPCLRLNPSYRERLWASLSSGFVIAPWSDGEDNVHHAGCVAQLVCDGARVRVFGFTSRGDTTAVVACGTVRS